MKCKLVRLRYAPSWSGALMDPAFLRRATNDRAASSDLSRVEEQVEPAGHVRWPGAQTWWKEALSAIGRS